ncbi:MAG TPA: hypothetical protein VM431_09885 [Phycisphaerae bacterium]|nr:hypothetical protein [Phycisphaerae bacterium]
MKHLPALIVLAVAVALVPAGGLGAAEEATNPFAPAKPKPAAAPAAGKEAQPVPARKVELPPEVRAIRGTFTPPERVLEAALVERSMNLNIPVKVDPKTGAFEVTGLRMGTYDFIIRTPWGRLEGVDMEPRISPYDVLIPPEYRTADLGLRAEGEFTEKDREAVRRIIHKVKRYENKITDMVISGSPDVAVVLMELLMDADFYSRKGDEVTWRIEQWFYEKKYDAWTTFRSRCLYRYRVAKAEWDSWGWQFEPRLGGFNITDDLKAPVTVEFAIPAKPVREKGLAGSKYPPADRGRTW